MKLSSQQSLSKLAEITDVILSQNTDYAILKDSLDKLTALFLSASKLNIDADVNATHLHLASGKAIGLKWAAMCIQDLIRTKQFMSGVNKAILDKQKTKTEDPIQILYAGSGPFATLVMPLITKFTPDEIQFTCLEVNPISVQSLKNVIDALDATAYFRAIHECDASQFQLPNEVAIDIVLIEVLQMALAREPQVAITYNLLPQLPKKVTLIPQEISLRIAVVNTKKEQEHMFAADPNKEIDYLTEIAEVFKINKDEVLAKHKESNVLTFVEKDIQFSKKQIDDNSAAAILTEIHVYDSFKLGLKDSGLTIPSVFADLNHEKELTGVKTQYVANNDPYLQTILIRKSPPSII